MMQWLAQKLDLSTTGSIEYTRQLITGKFAEMVHEPMNIQVERKEHLWRYRNRTARCWWCVSDSYDDWFNHNWTIHRWWRTCENRCSHSCSWSGIINETVGKSPSRKMELEEMVEKLQHEVETKSERSRDIWRTNCMQLTDFDKTLGIQRKE